LILYRRAVLRCIFALGLSPGGVALSVAWSGGIGADRADPTATPKRPPAGYRFPPATTDRSIFYGARNTDSARRRVLAGKIVVQEPIVNVGFYPSIYRQDGCRSRCGKLARFQASSPSAAS